MQQSCSEDTTGCIKGGTGAFAGCRWQAWNTCFAESCDSYQQLHMAFCIIKDTKVD